MIKLLTFLSALILYTNSFCQQAEIDSLKKIASTAKDDTTKAIALNKIAWLTTEDDPEGSLQNGFAALVLAQKAKNRFIEADCYKSIGVAYDYKGNLDSCILNLNFSLAIYKALNNTVKQSNVLSDIAIGYYARGIYELALKNHFASLELRKKINDSVLIGKSYNNIGLVYRARKDYDKAIEFYLKSLEIKSKLGDETGILNTTMNLGALYQNKQVYDSALLYASRSQTLAKKLNKTADISGSLGNIGSALNSLKKYSEALPILLQAEEEARKNNYKNHFGTLYMALSENYMAGGNYENALKNCLIGLHHAKENKRTELINSFYTQASNIYLKQENYKEAFLYRDSAEKVSQELLNKENLRQMNEMTAVYETAEKEKQISELNTSFKISEATAVQRKNERNILIIASVLLLGLAITAFAAFRANKKKKEQLRLQNTIIEKSLEEKEVLMKEIHHRVKNNLQVVSSLLKLQSHYIKDEAALDAVKESRNRVQSMAIIHQDLYQENNLTGIDAATYISKLCDNLFTSYNINPGKIKLVKEISPLVIDVDTIVPLGLIFNELISNSLKYAFTKKEEGGIIKIGLKEINKKLVLSVYDNGPGIDIAALDNSPSFGYKMINAFLPKLGGEMHIYNEDGARIDIAIKNYQLTTNE